MRVLCTSNLVSGALVDNLLLITGPEIFVDPAQRQLYEEFVALIAQQPPEFLSNLERM
jgi:hypothetical protein